MNNINNKLIIDFKPISPKDGDLFKNRDPVKVAKELEKAGILAISVVTEPKHFGGSLDLLRAVTSAVSLPVLRKDFVKDEDDLYQTAECGAKGILLICATIPKDDIGRLHKKAKILGLHPLVEVHSEEEMLLARQIGAEIIGINNKNITILEKDSGTVDTTLRLIKSAPKDAFIISESGITCLDDVKKALDCGVNAVLTGTAFWNGNLPVLPV